jgi:hypothetical protein
LVKRGYFVDVTIVSLIGKVAEAGTLIAFMILVIAVLCIAYRQLIVRNNQLVDLIFGIHKDTLEVVSKNSEIMTRLAERIDAKKGG